jgi:hypothetical protein
VQIVFSHQPSATMMKADKIEAHPNIYREKYFFFSVVVRNKDQEKNLNISCL